MQILSIFSLVVLLTSADALRDLSARTAGATSRNIINGVKKDAKAYGSGVMEGLSGRDLEALEAFEALQRRHPAVDWGRATTGAGKAVGTVVGTAAKFVVRDDASFEDGFHAGYSKRDLEFLEAREPVKVNSIVSGGLRALGAAQGAAASAFLGRRSIYYDDVDLYERDFDEDFEDF